MLDRTAAQWEAAGNGTAEPNTNQDHARTAVKQRSSLCPSAALGEEGIRKEHFASSAAQSANPCAETCPVGSIQKSKPTMLYHLTSCTGEMGSHPRLPFNSW